MSIVMSRRLGLVTFVAAGLALAAGVAPAQERFLAREGKAEAVIVVGQGGDTFDRWVAGELQRYLQALSGAELSIVTSDQVPRGKPLVVVGSPQSNPLVASAQKKQLVSFAGLKP